MRSRAIVYLLAVAGAYCAVGVVQLLAHYARLVSTHWLTAAALLPTLSAATGAIVAHKLSSGKDPWPVTDFSERFLFALIVAVIGGLTVYVSYVHLSALSTRQHFGTLLWLPNALPSLPKTAGRTWITDPLWLDVAVGFGLSAWLSNFILKKVLK